MARFEGSVALITGAGRGMGRAIAEAFAGEGAQVVACDLHEGDLAELSQALEAADVDHMESVCDVAQSEEVAATVSAAVERFGHIDILVNNAGISRVVPFLEMSDELWDRIMAVNLRGAYLFSKAVLPHMLARGHGKIINMGSQSGKRGNAEYAAYCASKFGIMGLTQSLAVEFAEKGINVNAVCPGVVLTPMWEEMLPHYARKRGMPVEEVTDFLASRIPMKRFTTPGEVAKVVLFLASEEAGYMTGQAINVTGGAMMA